MSWFAKLDIRNKLIFIILAVSFTVLVILSAARIIWDIKQEMQELSREITVLAELLGNRSSAALAFDDENLAKENLDSLRSISNITLSCLYRTDGSELENYNRDTTSNISCPQIKQVKEIYQQFDMDFLQVAVEIKQGNIVVGWIYIRSDLSPIYSQMKSQLIFTLLALVPAIIITLLLAGWAQKFISEPITKITDVARAIEIKGDNSLRAEINGSDEIGQLAHTFNEMLDALEKKNQQLRRSQKMDALGKLTGGVAHDYNNMLGVVLGYAELLESRLNDQPGLARYASEIQHAGQRGVKLTKKLLAFSRQSTSDADVLNINKLLNDMQHMLEKTITARVHLIYNLAEDVYPVWIDSGGLEDAILNLCINAMHAIDGSGKLTIQTTNETVGELDANSMLLPPGEYVQLSISDTGCGMNEETRERIFDPFFSTKGDKGTGLGLSQVYGFVKSCGGIIRVYSEPEKGTKFSLYFPRHHLFRSDEEVKQKEKTASLKGTETILLVDDEESLGILTAEMLSDQGYKVLTALNGWKALEILETEKVDVLFSDVIMPEMDGYQLAILVEEKYPDIKIQLASGFNDDRHLKYDNEELRKQLIMKPYTAQTILIKIRELLDNSN